MTNIKQPEADLSNFIKSLNPANILEFKKEKQSNSDKEIDIISIPTEATAGLYITRVFAKNGFDNFYSCIQKTIQEKYNNPKKKKYSEKTSFDFNTFKSEYADNNMQYIFSFFFNIILKHETDQSQIVLKMDIKSLPFNTEFEFVANNNNISTINRINNLSFSEYLNGPPQNYFDEILIEDFLKSAYDITIYQIDNSNKNKTYSDLINEISGTKNNSNLSFKNKITMEQPLKIGNKYELSYNKETRALILKFIDEPNSNNKNPPSFLRNNESSNKIISHETKLNDTNNLTNEQKSKYYYQYNLYKEDIDLSEFSKLIPNYYDISFDCKNLKNFMYSKTSPGFYVINYTPNILYTPGLSSFNSKGETQQILLDNLYKDIFKSKIIELDLTSLP